MTPDFESAVAGLASLGSPDDPGARPVILRVLVDLFALKPYHAPAEAARFEEIASRLIDRADPALCAFVARRIAGHPCAPPELLGKLARGSVEAAIAVMELAREVSPARLAAAAAWGPPEVAVAVAGRADLDGSLVAALAMRPEPEIALALARNPEAPLARGDLRALIARARADADLAAALLGRAAAEDAAALFLYADAGQRLAILAAAQRAAILEAFGGARPPTPRPPCAEALAALETAALAADAPRFADQLAALKQLDLDAARRLVADAGGEPLAVALAALALEDDLVDRILIFLAPGDGSSVQRYERLRRLALELQPHTAARLLEAFAGGGRPGPRGPHAPLLDGAGAPARAAETRRSAGVVTPMRRRETR